MVRRQGQSSAFVSLRGPLLGFCLGYMVNVLMSGELIRGWSSTSLRKDYLGKRQALEQVVSRAMFSEEDEPPLLSVNHENKFTDEELEEVGLDGEVEEEVGEETSEAEDEEVAPKAVSTAILLIVLLLILLTIGFEEAKEHIEESANRNMKPIIESLFAEMTVLGFLSVFTFALSKIGVFEMISVRVFGEEESALLLEVFESVHFALFFIMIFFVIQVLVLLKEGMDTETKWLEMDRACRDPEYINSMRRSSVHTTLRKANYCLKGRIKRVHSYVSLLPQMRNMKEELIEDHVVFQALREEFLKERSVDPPFRPLPEDRRVSSDFNFGRYLSMCLSHNLAHVVEVEVITWVVFAVFVMIFYVIDLAIGCNLFVLGWVWTGIGYGVILFNTYFEKHLMKTRKALAIDTPLSLPNSRSSSSRDLTKLVLEENLGGKETGSDYFISDGGSHGAMENHDFDLGGEYLVPIKGENDCLLSSTMPGDSLYSALNDGNGGGGCGMDGGIDEGTLPAWCKVDLDEYMLSRPLLARLVNGKNGPNRQQALFWLERRGPHVHLFILQLNLVFTGLYCALALLTFCPVIYEKGGGLMLLLYVILSSVPPLAIMLNKQHLIATMTECGCAASSLRKPQIVAEVLREEKTARAVRAFVVLYKIHRGADMAMQTSMRKSLLSKSIGDEAPKLHYSRSFNKLELNEVSKTFEAFDRSGDGFITRAEFEEIVSSLGGEMDPKKVKCMIKMLDEDGDGQISREEFLQWYSDSMTQDDLTSKERAAFLFRMFDEDGNGEITVGEFKTTLDTLNIGFSVDEIGDIVRELDEDKNGVISEEEFEQLLERYYPQELAAFYDIHQQTR